METLFSCRVTIKTVRVKQDLKKKLIESSAVSEITVGTFGTTFDTQIRASSIENLPKISKFDKGSAANSSFEMFGTLSWRVSGLRGMSTTVHVSV